MGNNVLKFGGEMYNIREKAILEKIFQNQVIILQNLLNIKINVMYIMNLID